jgi:hypothetical protein
MWVSVILGFDSDGQVVERWREAFQRHGELVGELSIGEEYVASLRRHTSVARVRVAGEDILQPLADTVVRAFLGSGINISGVTSDPVFNKWRPQAWRMQILPTQKISGDPVHDAPTTGTS